MRSRGDRLRCLPCVAHGARPAPALAALVCSPAPLAHQGARPPASLALADADQASRIVAEFPLAAAGLITAGVIPPLPIDL